MVRIANSLDTLRTQINNISPGRSKENDGWIGDTRHQALKSDHNPNSKGVVQAIDITHNPPTFDAYKLAEVLRNNRDPRIKYVISNKKIFSSSVEPWVWRKYSGTNAHSQHTHISVLDNSKLYDDPKEWNLKDMTPTTIIDPYEWHTNIVATVFGEESGTSAYDPKVKITKTLLGVALPCRLTESTMVEVRYKDKTVIAPVVDVGPWNTKDPYWVTGSRPQAESGKDLKGRKTNLAGIDLTYAVADKLGLKGKGKVDWRFVEEAKVTTPTANDVSVKPPLYSKINWTQIVSMVSAMAVYFNLPELDKNTQLVIAAAIPVVFGTATMVFRTWFNNTVIK